MVPIRLIVSLSLIHVARSAHDRRAKELLHLSVRGVDGRYVESQVMILGGHHASKSWSDSLRFLHSFIALGCLSAVEFPFFSNMFMLIRVRGVKQL